MDIFINLIKNYDKNSTKEFYQQWLRKAKNKFSKFNRKIIFDDKKIDQIIQNNL